MYDDDVRRSVADMEVPRFDDTPFVQPLAAPTARFAIVTTAGLVEEDDEYWQRGDLGFRIIDGAPDALRLGHRSQNVDRIAFEYDYNVVFPLDRLNELAAEGAIGSVADRHLTFMGAQRGNLQTITIDSGPAAAEVLLEDDVDAALLTPI